MSDPALDIRDSRQPAEMQAEWQAILDAAAKFSNHWGWDVVCVSAPRLPAVDAGAVGERAAGVPGGPGG